MARYLVLATCCVMVIACFLYTTDALNSRWSCSRRCSRNCDRQFPYRRGGFYGVGRFFYRRGFYGVARTNWLNNKRMDCKRGCYGRLANCRICPFAGSCQRCVKGYQFNDNGRCVATGIMPTTPATTPAPPPAETTAGAPVETCSFAAYKCLDGKVIALAQICDQNNDCSNGDDEGGACGATAGTYMCSGVEHPTSELCNCVNDCGMGELDESPFVCFSACPVGQYICSNNSCAATAAECPTTT